MFYVRLGERQENLRGEPLAFSYEKITKSSYTRFLFIFYYYFAQPAKSQINTI
jgi:hypothetical protein